MIPFKVGAGFPAIVGLSLIASLTLASASPNTDGVYSPASQPSGLYLAQAQPAPPAPAPASPPAAPPTATPTAADSIGTVVTLQGSATVTRANATKALKLNDEIFNGDTLRTGTNGALGITLDDETTFNMGASATMLMDNLVYQSGGRSNVGLFNVARGTVAFVAGQVAHTGDMKIATPTATLGVRGTTGVIEVPDNATAPGDVAIKLYNDADGRLGRIEIFGAGPNAQQRLGILDRAASGFSIRRGAAGGFGAFALKISPQQAARDRGFVGQLFRTHDRGRQLVIQRRDFRQRNPQGVPGQRGGLNQQRGPGQPQQRGPGLQQRGPNNLGQPNLRQQPGGPQRLNPRGPAPPRRANAPRRPDLQNAPQQPIERGPSNRRR